jgi:hypothetical protein
VAVPGILGSLTAMLAFLAGAIAVSGGRLGAAERLVFTGLSGWACT